MVELTLIFPSGKGKGCKVPLWEVMVLYPCCGKLQAAAQNETPDGKVQILVSLVGSASEGAFSQELCSVSLWIKGSVCLTALPWACGTLMLWTVVWASDRGKATFQGSLHVCCWANWPWFLSVIRGRLVSVEFSELLILFWCECLKLLG